tara:strand:- start:292 stop:660 length:369 start_codon:yes stop_codon:yes gene_type:complete
MTKNIFSLFIFLISASAFSSTITEVFTIENGNNLQSQMTKANSKRLKLINDLVYLAIINDRRYEDCWSKFRNGRSIKFEISETEMNIISSNDKSVTYELLIDTKKVIFPESVKLEFKSFCNQ